MTMQEDREMALGLVESNKVAFVSSVRSDGYPQTRAMFNLRSREHWPRLVPLFRAHGDDFMLLFTTNTSSTKVNDFRRNPKVSVYFCEPDVSRGCMLGGNMEIIDDLKLKKAIWHDGWEVYYPKGYDDPDHSVLRLFPIIGRGWNQNHTYQFRIEVEQ